MLYRLSYVSGKRMERVAGIEPASSAWKAEVLPLNYTRVSCQFARFNSMVDLTVPIQHGGGGRIRTFEG